MIVVDMTCKNCNYLNPFVYDSTHSVIACSQCGLVKNDSIFNNKKIDIPSNVDTICITMNTILSECLPLFNIHKNVEKVLKKKMLNILKSNKQIGKLKNLESIIFTLLIYAIRDLRIPLNKSKINDKIKQYVRTNSMLKDLNNIKL
jgi:hypothetical protein